MLDVGGFYTPLLVFLDQMVEQRFMRPEQRAMVLAETDPRALLARFAAYEAPILGKWVDRSTV